MMNKDMLNKKDVEEIEENDRIIKMKIKEAENSKVKMDFYNYGTMNMLMKTPADVICELGIRVFAGSRDVPKDTSLANILIETALFQAEQVGNQE